MNNFNNSPLTSNDIDQLEFGYSHEEKVEFVVIFNDEIDMKVVVNFEYDSDLGELYYFENTITSIESRDWNQPDSNNDPSVIGTTDLEKVRLIKEFIATDFIQDKWIESFED